MLDAQSDIDTSSETTGLADPSGTAAQPNHPFLGSIHLHRNDPWRRPDWRWRRARMLLTSHEAPSPERDDEFVELALRFLQEDHSGSQPPDPQHLLPMETRMVIQRAQQIYCLTSVLGNDMKQVVDGFGRRH